MKTIFQKLEAIVNAVDIANAWVDVGELYVPRLDDSTARLIRQTKLTHYGDSEVGSMFSKVSAIVFSGVVGEQAYVKMLSHHRDARDIQARKNIEEIFGLKASTDEIDAKRLRERGFYTSCYTKDGAIQLIQAVKLNHETKRMVAYLISRDAFATLGINL